MSTLESMLSRGRAFVVASAFALYGMVLYRTAWLSEDVWITLRTVDNFVHGYGLTWNAYERVQVYTHPLWMFVMSLVYGVTGEGYFTIIALSFVLSMAVLALAFRAWKNEPARLLVFALLLVSSKAFIDYSSSGLENPLTHILAFAFFARYLARDESVVATERELILAILLASTSYFNRADSILLFAPSLIWLSWRARRSLRYRLARAWLVGTLPASLWTVFGVIYYGFPVPNTAFAKLAGGHYHASIFHPNAITYYTNSLSWDWATLPVIVGGIGVGAWLACRRRSGLLATTIIGLALLLLYALRIGGDYMSGRLFALPFLVAAVILVRELPTKSAIGLGAVGLLVGSIAPRSAFKDFRPAFAERDRTGIIDDRSFHHLASLHEVMERRDYKIGKPRQFDRSRIENTLVWGATGFYGYQSGPVLRTVDNLALSDALLARLPTRDPERMWGRGHLWRDIPPGYLSSVETAENRIVDPSLHEYYDALLVITTGPLFTTERFRVIWGMSTGHYAHLIDEYEVHRYSAH